MPTIDKDRELTEMGSLFKDIAEWAVQADKYEVAIVVEELAKLRTHLSAMAIVKTRDEDDALAEFENG